MILEHMEPTVGCAYRLMMGGLIPNPPLPLGYCHDVLWLYQLELDLPPSLTRARRCPSTLPC
jgi:hypothetical protein